MKLTRIAALLLSACSVFAQAPSISTEPVAQAACAGGTASFSVTAAGAEPLSYQWYLATATATNVVSGGTNALLNLTNLTAAAAGGYSVIITNNEGSATSVVATLTVNALTTVAGPTNRLNQCLGAVVPFVATASGTGPFSYRWLKDGVEIGGETASSINVTVSPTTAGTYTVEVSGLCNSVTNSASLSIAAGPSITAQPQSQETPVGNGATFTVTATTAAGTTLTYQWKTNGVNVPGANANSYSISNLTFVDSGLTVAVDVSNCNGSVSSSVATLTVTPISGISFDFNTPGQYTNHPYYLTYNNFINNGYITPLAVFESPIGGTGPFPGGGSLDLAPNNGTDNTFILMPLTYDFSLTGKILYASTMVKIKNPVANNRSTQIGFVTSTNLGIADTSPQAFMSVIMQSTAQPAPTFDLRTQRRSTTGGIVETTGLTTAQGLTVSNWYRLNVSFENIRTATTSNFVVTATLQDMGPLGTAPGSTNLSFRTTNSCDIVLSRQVYFAIRGFENTGVENRDNTYVWTASGNIAFVQQPADQTVLQGRRAQFRALVDGEGPYAYQWFKNGTAIPGAKSWNYIVPAAKTSDNGSTYHVEVTGPANTITSSAATLSVTSEALDVVSVGSVDGTTVGVMFNQPVDPATAENPANYSINGTAAVGARVYRTSLGPLGPEGIYVVLTPASIVSGAFTVTVTGVKDLSDNVIASPNNSANGQVENLVGVDINPLIVAPAGEHYSFGPGRFIVSGGGVDIWNNADSFHYVYTTKTGDFDVVARVPYIDAVRGPTKAGIDARSSLDPAATRVSVFANPINFGRQYPEGSYRQSPNIAAASYGNTPRLNYPDAWIRLRRMANTFIRYSSSNGINWVLDGQFSPNPALPATLYVGLGVCSVANTIPASAQFESYSSFGGYSGATITLVSNPTNITVNAGSGATIGGLVATVAGGGVPASAGELAYIWQRSDGLGGWTNMPTAGATNHLLSVGTVFRSDNGSQFRAIIAAPGALSVTSLVATLTVNDTAVPTIAGVNNFVYPSYPIDTITINFSEPITLATATDIANYTVTNANGAVLAVLSASFLGTDTRTVVLKVNGVLGQGTASVGISGIRDLNNNLLATTARTFRTFPAATAPVVVEVYQEIGTETVVSGLTANALYTSGRPTWIAYSNMFGFNVGLGGIQDRYGVKIYSYFVAPSNGLYKFWLKSDDGAQFWMNTNAVNSTDPAGKVLITENTASVGNTYTINASSITNVSLVSGQRYYIEALLKENSGGDGFAVMWTASTVTTAPGNGTYIPFSALEFPAAVAPATPVIMELYTGYTPPVANNGTLPTLTSATNYPPPESTYVGDVVNYKYIASVPDVIGYQKNFSAQSALTHTRYDNYLGRIYAYFIPPTNGLYKFYMRSDDASQLYMNTNAVNSTDPYGKRMLGRLDAFTSAYTLVAQNISLVGGQPYYIEGLWREGTGGDGIAIAVRSQGDSSVPSITAPVETIPTSMLAYPAGICRASDVNFARIGPANPTVQEGRSMFLSAEGIVGAGPYGYIWYKNGQRILDNSFTNQLSPVSLSDNGAEYTLVITNQWSSVTRSTTLTVVADTTVPTIVRTTGARYGDSFTIEFSEPVDPTTATFLGNYQVSGGLTLLTATLDPVLRNRVTIYTSAQSMGTTYTVTVNNVKDLAQAGNTIAPNTLTQFSTWSVGGSAFLVEIWTNIAGSAVQDLVGQPRFQASTPDVIYYTNVFGVGAYGAHSGLESYGARVTGYFVPTNTGYYRFYVRSDDASQLWMNINSSDSENPAGRTMLIHMPNANITMGDPRAQSQPVLLNQGQRYYIEGLVKEGGGGDYLLVAFRPTDANGTADGGTPADAATSIANVGNFGGAPGNPDALQITATPPSNINVEELQTVNIALQATVPAYLRSAGAFQWQKWDGGAFTNIPGGTAQNLSFIARLADDGAQYRLNASFPGLAGSWVTTLHVTANTTPPTIVGVGSIDGKTVTVQWNEPIDPQSGTESLFYDIGGATMETEGSGTLLEDQRTVVFRLQPVSYITTSPFMLGAAGVGNQAATIAYGLYEQAQGVVEFLTPELVGVPAVAAGGYNPTVTNYAVAISNGTINVSANGWDIWNAADGFFFAHRLVTGNFDVKVRVASLIGADQWSKAGWMIRPALTNISRNIFGGVAPTVSPVVGQAPVNNYTFQWRDADGASAAPFLSSYNSGTNPPPYPNAWVRMQRVGPVINLYNGNDGTNWSLYATRNTAEQSGGAYPDTVYVGLATVSHDQTRGLANNAYAEYRNLYFPLAPTITQQPLTTDNLVVVGGSFTISDVAATGAGPFTYQWRRNGVALPGQNTATLTVNNAQASDSGNYQVLVGNDGGGTLSAPLQIVVSNSLPVAVTDNITIDQGAVTNIPASVLLGNDTDGEGSVLSILAVSGLSPVTWSANFDDGLVPTNTTIYGSLGGGYITTNAGVGDSGTLRLTDAVASQAGALVLSELTPLKRVAAFTASFKIRIGNGSAQPADGFSFAFGAVPSAVAGGAENGVGAGTFSFTVDNYQFFPFAGPGSPAGAPGGGTANTAGMKIIWNNVNLAGVQIPVWNSTAFVPVTVTVTADGVATVTVDGTNVFGNVALPGFTPRSGRFGFYARNGGQFQTHWVDDANITVFSLDTARNYAAQNAALYGSAYIGNEVGVANSGAVHLTDAANSQSGAFIINELTPGSAIQSFNASFKVRIGNGTADAADGLSFNLASDLPNGVAVGAAEEGVGTGLAICIDNYPGAGPGSPAIKVKFGGIEQGAQIIPKWNLPSYVPVSVTLDADGTVDVIVNGTNVFSNLQLTNYVPVAGRFGFFGRTGGQNETHWVDDISINVTTASGPAGYAADFNSGGPGQVTYAGGTVTYNPGDNACGTDTFYYLLSDGQTGGVTWGTVNVAINPTNGTLPTIQACVWPRTVTSDQSGQYTLPDLRGELVASGNCLTVSQSPAPGTVVGAGVTSVTFTVTDVNNNQAGCQTTVTVLSDGVPGLTVVRNGANVEISWPQTASTYILQENPDVTATGSWITSPATVNLVSGRYVAIVAADGTTKYFRLLKQ